MGAFDDLIPKAEAPSASSFADLIPKQRTAETPMELSIGEKLISMLPEGAQKWLSDPSVAGVSIGKGSAVHGTMLGASDPVAGAAQLVTLGQSPIINQAIDAKNADYEAARKGQGRDGVDMARFVGNVASPANVAIGSAAPITATSKIGRFLQGIRSGLAGGLVAPVENADESYATEKTGQGISGAVMGGVLTPVVGKLGDMTMRRFSTPTIVERSLQIDEAVSKATDALRAEGITLNNQQAAWIRQQVADSLANGKSVDGAALLRNADFNALGMKPTLGQITRDPAIYSKEKNLRGVSGGEGLLQRFNEQAKRMQELVTQRSDGALDDYTAGEKLIRSLQGVDDNMRGPINAAYDSARDHLGRAAPMDHVAFSTMANQAIDDQMLNAALPTKARKILNDVTTGKIPLTVNSAEMIKTRLAGMARDLQSQGNKEGALAVGKLREALENTPIADNVGEDAKLAFDAARTLAKGRFSTLEAIPALKAAIDGDVSAQDFVRRFLINGKAEEVSALAKVLPEDARREAARQFGALLERSAFGQNISGDKAFAAESFARLMNQPGMRQKLSAFFSPDDLAQFDQLMRVGTYMNSFPANNVVNTSNTGAAINMLSHIPGVPASIGLLNAARNAAGNQMAIKSSLAANPATKSAELTPTQLHFLARALGSVGAGISGFAGTSIGDE